MQTTTNQRPTRVSRPRSTHPVGWLAAGLAALFPLIVPALAPPAAQAEPPLSTIGAAVTDHTGVLSSDLAAVNQALDRVAAKTNYQLFVVYVSSFDGLGGQDWANQTATAAHLGREDLLLAVAVDDRLWGFACDDNSGLSPAQQSRIENALVDRLRNNDWSGAVIAAADQLTGGSSTGSSAGWVAGGTVVLVGAVGGYAAYRGRRKSKQATANAAGDELSHVSTAELKQRAGSALVNLDNAVRSSQDELNFAQAEFGLEATDPFRAALTAATRDAGQAFAIQQQLNDSQPETEPQQRVLLAQLLQLCDHANAALDEQTKSFEDLRDLVNRAPQVLNDTEQRAGEVEQRLAIAQQTLATLARTYPATALASISPNPDQATALIAAARESIGKGRAALEDGNNNQAVAFARLGQNAIAQAAGLLDSVDSAQADLAAAGAKVQAQIASLSADLADARRLAPGDPAVGPAASEAQAALEQAQAVSQGGDPLAAISRLTMAETVLDNALVPARGAEAAARKAAQSTQQTLAHAQQLIDQTNQYISLRRSAIGNDARTRLSEALRLVGVAQQLLATDPIQAYAAAQQGLANAQQAYRLAQADADSWGSGNGGYGGGGIGNVLTGVVIGSMLGGGRGGGGFSGGFHGGGGSFGGGFHGGGGGSFGGGFHGGGGGHF